MKNGTLLWFKNDLRLHDNEALVKAINRGAPILYFYCLDPRLFRTISTGFKKTGYNRFLFLKQTLQDLKESLTSKGVNLALIFGKAEKIIPKMINTYDIDHIITEQEYADEELKLIKKVRENIPQSIQIEKIWGKTLYHIDDIPFDISNIPLTSKAYRIPTGKNTEVRKPFDIPKHFPEIIHQEGFHFPSPKEVGFTDDDTKTAQPYVIGGEQQALRQLQHYTFDSQLLTTYRWTRNRSLGMDYSSKFSPYLAVGALSPRTVYQQVKKYENEIKKNQSTWWLVFELVWRDYFTFKAMRMGNSIFKTEGYRSKKLTFTNDTTLFNRWCQGVTGIPFVDAHMRQLNKTGYMSNRGRVNCASFLVHDYQVDWTWGAAYFEKQLIDYDVTSNWMNWHMQAYEIWYTNPIYQSLKYKANEYLQKWIPELKHLDDNFIHIPWLSGIKSDYPNPVTIYKKWDRSIGRILKTIEKAES